MLKSVAAILATLSVACFSAPALHGEQFLLLAVQNLEGPGLQGIYLLGRNDGNLVSLKTIDSTKKLPDVKVDEVVSTLEKAYPKLAGDISLQKFDEDVAKLVKEGTVRVSGQIHNPGTHPAASLGDFMAVAKPTNFGSTMRIQVIHKGTVSLYDLGRKDHAATKLEPGDIVYVPTKKIIGR